MTKEWTLTDELVQKILDRLAEGESLRKICQDPDMPSRHTVMRWQDDNPDFATKCARAREWQADYMDDLVMETAQACTPETAVADRVKISAYQWRASKLAPKKYGDKLAVGGDPDAPPIKTDNRIEIEFVKPKA